MVEQMDETKYVCEPHYDENGKFDYWNPLFTYKRDTCKGCSSDGEQDNTALTSCTYCSRNPNFYDNYEMKEGE